MEYKFLLAERIVTRLKGELVKNEEIINYYSFKSCTINPQSILIEFVKANSDFMLKISLSLHPLDMPWKFRITIGNKVLESNHEIYPNLLKDPNGLGNKLSHRIAMDIVDYLKDGIKE